MNYKDLQNISYLSQQILTEASSEEHDVMNRWPYASPYLQEERAEGVRPYKAGPTQAEVRADAKRAAKKKAEADKDKPSYGPEDKFKSDWKLRAVPSSTSKRKDGEEETVSQRMNREAPYKTRPFSPLFTKQGSRTASAVTRATEGPGEPQSVTMPRQGRDKKKKPSREIVRKNQINAEFELWVNSLLDEGYDLSDYTWDDVYNFYINENNVVDLYDIVLSHLLDEGYTDTIEGAESIMANMSEEWRDSIFEMFGPSLGLNVAATRTQSQTKPTTKPPLADIRGGGGNKAKPTAKPAGFRPNLATASSTFGQMLQQ